MLDVCTMICLAVVMTTPVSGCSNLYRDEVKNYRIYYGWPLAIECKTALDEVYIYDDDTDLASPVTCIITDRESDLVIFNVTQNASLLYYRDDSDDIYGYRIENVTYETSSEYHIFVEKGGLCRNLNVTLRKLELLDESCEANLNRRPVFHTPVYTNQTFGIHCDAPADDPGAPGNLIGLDDFGSIGAKFRWLFNCNTTLPENTVTAENSYLLKIYSAKYSRNPGIYTCEVEYNGMTRYRIHYELCVSPKNSHILTARCNNPVGKLNSDVSVECNIDAGLGATQEFGFHGFFQQLQRTRRGGTSDDLRCYSVKKTNGSRVTCDLERNKVNGSRCFKTIPTDEELRAQVTYFTFVYTIRNLKDSDFGNFAMTFSRANNVKVSVNFTISENYEDESHHTQRILIVIFVVFGVVLFLSLMLWIFAGIEIRWLWHKLCKSHENGNKTFGAYLTYHYNKDMAETTPSQLENFVNRLNSHFQNLGVRIFDSSRDSSVIIYKAEGVSSTLKDCHRVIILLTPEYVNDQWEVYEAYEAWRAVIENAGIKIIFILFPTTLLTMNKLSGDLKTSLQQALKRHNVIHWNGKMPISRRLWMQLDTLMPKITTQNYLKCSFSNLSKHKCESLNPDEEIMPYTSVS